MGESLDMAKKIQIVVGILTIVGVVWGGIWTFTDKIATAEDLKRLESMTIATFKTLQDGMDIKFLQQQLTLLQDRKYRIRDEMRKNPSDESLKQDYEKVNKDITEIENQLMNINKPIKTN